MIVDKFNAEIRNTHTKRSQHLGPQKWVKVQNTSFADELWGEGSKNCQPGMRTDDLFVIEPFRRKALLEHVRRWDWASQNPVHTVKGKEKGVRKQKIFARQLSQKNRNHFKAKKEIFLRQLHKRKKLTQVWEGQSLYTSDGGSVY